jgi:hypothetical protein
MQMKCMVLFFFFFFFVFIGKVLIPSSPKLSSVGFGIFIGVPHIYGAFVCVIPLLLISARLVQRSDY